jgi:predicted metalloprotease with PDZ domain
MPLSPISAGGNAVRKYSFRFFTIALSLIVLYAASYAGTNSEGHPTLSYEFSVIASSAIQVNMEFEGGLEGFTVLGLCINKWEGLENCDHVITALSVVSVDTGKAIEVEHPEHNIWVFDNEPGKPVRVTYRLQKAESSGISRDFLPTIGSDFAFFWANIGLLAPEHLVNLPYAQIRCKWELGTHPAWLPVSSFSDVSTDIHLQMPLLTFLRGFFFAGDKKKIVMSGIEDGTVRVAWLIDPPKEEVQQRILSTLASARQAVSTYLGEEAGKGWLWLAMPRDSEGISLRTLESSFLLLYPHSSFPVEKDYLRLQLMAAHEYVHSTPTGILRLTGGPVPADALSEGFSEFIARRALLRQHSISLQQWAVFLNEMLDSYSELQALVNEREVDPPAISGRRMPYIVGDAFAVIADSEIRLRSDGEQDLKKLIALLLARAERQADSISLKWSDLHQAIASLMPADAAQHVESVLQGKEVLGLNNTFFNPCAVVEREPGWVFDVGFDLKTSIFSRVITGVHKSSEAFKAGLRDGGILANWGIEIGRFDIPARVGIREGDQVKTIEYFPKTLKPDLLERVFLLPDAKTCANKL